METRLEIQNRAMHQSYTLTVWVESIQTRITTIGLGIKNANGKSNMRKTPQEAYRYARNVIEGRWPKGEAIIARDAEWSFWYACDVLKERFEKGEAIIAQNAKWAYWYVINIIKGRWPKAESAIESDEEFAKLYEKYVLKLSEQTS